MTSPNMDYHRQQSTQSLAQVLAESPDFAPHIHYVLEQRGVLGEGGMGRVLRVNDKRLGRDAALKILQPSQGDMDAILRFKREAQIMARLDHPGIPPVYESGMTPEGQPFLLMKIVQGATLTERIAQYHEDGCPEDERDELLRTLIKVSEAVAYAHSRGVIHRDLKPDNIMIGQYGEVLVMDWGLAKLIKEKDDPRLTRPSLVLSAVEAQELGATQAGTVLGTPGFMSPEQVNGEQVSERTDVFALGAILFRLLSNERIVEGDTPFKILSQTLKGRVREIAELKPGLPEELQALCGQALTLHARERLASALDFANALRSFLDRSQRRSGLIWLPWFMTVVLTAVVVALAWQGRRHKAELKFTQEQLESQGTQLKQAQGRLEQLSRPKMGKTPLASGRIHAIYQPGQIQPLLSLLEGEQRPRSDWFRVKWCLERARDHVALEHFYGALDKAFPLSDKELFDWFWFQCSETQTLRPPALVEACERAARDNPESRWLKLMDWVAKPELGVTERLAATARWQEQGLVHPGLYYLRAKYFFLLKSSLEAQAALDAALALAPMASCLHRLQVDLQTRTRDFEGSVQSMERYSWLRSSSESRKDLADHSYRMGHWRRALRVYESLLTELPKGQVRTMVKIRKGFCLERLGRVEAARRIYQNVAGADPRSKVWAFYRIRAIHITHPKSDDDYLRQLKKLIQVQPKFADLQYERAYQEWRAGNIKEASAAIELAFAHKNQLCLFTFAELKGLELLLAVRKLSIKDPRKLQGFKDLKGWLEGFPTRTLPGIVYDYAMELKLQGRWRVAAELLEVLSLREPRNTELVKQSCELFRLSKQDDKALRAIRRARWAGNRSPWLTVYEGQVLAVSQNSQRALVALEQSPQSKAVLKSVEAFFFCRALSKFQLSDYQGAMTEIEPALKIRRDQQYLALYGVAAIETRRPEVAERILKEALSRDPENAELLFHKARLCLLQGRGRQAQLLLKTALEKQKNPQRRAHYQKSFKDYAEKLKAKK